MKRYKLHFAVTLTEDLPGYNQFQNQFVHEALEISGLSFFQVCVILGGLQVLIDEERNKQS